MKEKRSNPGSSPRPTQLQAAAMNHNCPPLSNTPPSARRHLQSPGHVASEWLYISGCNNTTTTDQVIAYVREKIGTKDVTCYSLLRNFVHPLSQRQLSFKIKVPAQFINSMLRRSFWPQGVLVRKFVNNSNFLDVRQGLQRPTATHMNASQMVDRLLPPRQANRRCQCNQNF